jgi:pimeloyl-ACP methyl ester carboxylesterase
VYPRWLLITLRTFFAALSVLSPNTAGRIALRLFCTPRRHHRPGWERAIADCGQRAHVGPNLMAHIWEPTSSHSGPRIVLLVHGWEGRGTQLGRFVEPLVEAGYRVVALDNPAHGESSGRRTDLIEATEALRKVGRELGPLAGIVAHSFGGAVTMLALERGLDAASVVLIGAPSSVEDVIARFGALAGVRGRAMKAFRRGIERQTGVKIKDVEIFERVAGLRIPALIVHDRDDREVPFGDAERLAARWRSATLMATSGLGHRRILKDDRVIRRAVDFISQTASGRAEAIQSLSSSATVAPGSHTAVRASGVT